MKLENVFLNDKLNVKIGNFGVARRLDPYYDPHHDPQTKPPSGTTDLMAPEVLIEKRYSYEADRWSYCCTVDIQLVSTRHHGNLDFLCSCEHPFYCCKSAQSA